MDLILNLTIILILLFALVGFGFMIYFAVNRKQIISQARKNQEEILRKQLELPQQQQQPQRDAQNRRRGASFKLPQQQ